MLGKILAEFKKSISYELTGETSAYVPDFLLDMMDDVLDFLDEDYDEGVLPTAAEKSALFGG